MTDQPVSALKSNRRFWVALNQVDLMAPDVLFRLVEKFGDPEQVWSASEAELAVCLPPKSKVLMNLLSLRTREDGSEELARAADLGFRVVTIVDPDYPELLKDIPFPPSVLYVKGEIKKEDERAVAIVGTRECNGYGRRVATDLAGELSAHGYTIVSGMAHGIDAAAHRGALEAGGRTIAVKAVGLDVNYPEAHKKLSEQIAAQGAVVSEFPIGMNARDKWQFPRRNRVISGLSRGTIVVQARERSGSLITANHAVEQGRPIFAVPGDVLVPLMRGCHWLIRHGAHLVESASDVLEIFGEAGGQTEIEFTEETVEGTQKDVLDVLRNGLLHFDEICARLGRNAREVSAALMMLEMKGLVREIPGKLFEAR